MIISCAKCVEAASGLPAWPGWMFAALTALILVLGAVALYSMIRSRE